MKGKSVLVLGGTGAMGTYLVPLLYEMGYRVDVVALDGVSSNNPSFSYINANAKNDEWLREQLKTRYDAIVDFMIYSTKEFDARHQLLLDSTDHYIFFSTYRIYAQDVPITEESPRLLDVSDDKEYIADAEQEYSLYKALQENILRNSEYKNYTIVRPAITYSKRRLQLVTMEADIVIQRASKGLPVAVPRDALDIQATMSWAGDVGKMLSGLVLNPRAFGEAFTLATVEHRSWREIAEYYKELAGLNYVPVDTEDYIKIMGGKFARYQLQYDRMYNRIVDNSKILKVTGLRQEDFTLLRDGLKRELGALPKDFDWGDSDANRRMSEYFESL